MRSWIDKLQIQDLVRAERFARDSGDWDGLAAFYVDESYVRTTWFQGSARQFSDASREMAQNGRHSKHPIWPIWVKVNGDRALVESHSQIQNRSDLDGVEVDMVQYCRFFSQLVRTVEGWRFLSFEAIYGKDTIAPVNPRDTVPIDWTELTDLRPSYRIWAWAMIRRGYSVSDELLGDDRPAQVRDFYAGMDRWLLGLEG
jgi:hypothetical protein